MRILQLIDSLRPGGAERMAVSYANALARRGQESFLCCTRMEGLLKNKVEPKVGYLFLEKRHTLDHRAFIRLRNFVKEHQIQFIQAHSSSYFLAVMVKWAVPGVKVIWHDHYGKELGERKDLPLKLMSRYFDGVISVNEPLKIWAQQHLKARNIVFIKNFLPEPSFEKLNEIPEKLRGEHKIKIICVANLRPQKDHFNLLKAFTFVLEEFPEVGLHLIGKDEENNYSKELKLYIKEHGLQENVFLYGEQENIQIMLKQVDIAVLSSSSEGLPVALLEYGMAGLPVVCTDVGEVRNILKGNGITVPPNEPSLFAEAIKNCMSCIQENIRLNSNALQKDIARNFSETAILPGIISFYGKVGKDKDA